MHPKPPSQESTVQVFPSSQSGSDPERQTPPEQISPKVQAVPSSQGLLLAAWVQPVAGTQASVVHGF